MIRTIRIVAELAGILLTLSLFPVIVLVSLPYLWWSDRRNGDTLSQRQLDALDK